jgi:L-cysteine:1D-myo-inositol 2-amino-2-deoxy-alpha-D-glucopyranoside ligase
MRAIFAERGGDPARPGKHDPLDALVWRLARPGEPAWDSPLGRGRPGWHVECVALALDTLGPAFDLQGGGADLIFPHHEMCAAQTVTATGQPLARAYAHVAMVGLEGEKMSKSKGNLVLVSQLLRQGVDPMAIRLALLAHHYRTEWSWTDDDRLTAERRLAVWRAVAGLDPAQSAVTDVDLVQTGGRSGQPASSAVDGPAVLDPVAATVITSLRGALCDDLHADRALDVVDGWAAAPSPDPASRAAVVRAVDALLGVAL